MAATDVAPPKGAAKEVTTYHCLCSNLILATTFPLSSLARRASPPAQDCAYILPCPPPPRDLVASGSDSEDDDEEPSGASDLTALLSLTMAPVNANHTAKNPLLVRREDGFEKRWILRCGRCGVPVGYQLDWAQFIEASTDGQSLGERKGRRADVLYLFPGALVTTKEMARGERPKEGLITVGDSATG